MFYSPMLILVIIFVLINSSYEFNVRNNIPQRLIRNTELRSDTQRILNNVINDEEITENRIKESLDKDQDAMKKISRNIFEAANRMAQAGSQDIRSVDQWTYIQSELHKGINLITDAYRRYIDFHRTLCDDIEKFTKDMISKYENELSVLDRMSVPTSATSGSIDRDSPAWIDFFHRYKDMQDYANIHSQTSLYGLDAIKDLLMSAANYHSQIFHPSKTYSQTIVLPSTSLSTNDPYTSIIVNCNDIAQYNGNQICPDNIARLTQQYAVKACACAEQQ